MGIIGFFQDTLTQKEKCQSAWLFVLLVVASFLESLSLGAILPLFKLFDNSNFLSSFPILQGFESRELILLSTFFLALIFLVKTVFISFLVNWQAKFAFRVMYRISSAIFDKYALTSLGLDSGRDNAKITRNVIREPNFLVGGILLPMFTIATDASVIFGVLVLLFIFSPTTTSVLIISLGLASFLILSIARPVLRRLGTEVQLEEGARLRGMSNILGGGKDLFLFDMGKLFSRIFHKSTLSSSIKLARQQFLKQVTRLLLELSAIFILCSLISVGIFIGWDPSDILTLVAIYVVGLFRILPAANRIVINLNTISFNRASLVAVASELRQVRSDSVDSQHSHDRSNRTGFGDWCFFEFKRINFSYSPGSDPVIKDFSLKITRGEKVALMGESGSGKSTILDLLLGLQKVDSGTLTLNGVNGSWQIPHLPNEMISYAPQKTFLIEASIVANIALDDYFNNVVDNARLEAAVKGAMLHDVIGSVPGGLNGSVGEAGSALSGGELQRIGIARALYREADVLLLDEATSALDAPTERMVIEAFLTDPNRTVICVTHSVEAASLFDRRVEIKSR